MLQVAAQVIGGGNGPRSRSRAPVTYIRPWFTSPMRLTRGTRTSSKNVWLTRWSRQLMRGRTSMPGKSIGIMMSDRPRCLGASWSVRTSSHSCVAEWAKLFQILEPLITHSSPSRSARVRSEARSVPASGSE
jgi:hypothetical protein